MIHMSKETIKQKLNDHALWLMSNGEKGAQANFSDADLSGMDFNRMHLERAIFNGAKLEEAKFSEADLDKADFLNADLTNADLSFSSLICAGMCYANMTGSSLFGANLHRACCDYVQFTNSDLREANLSRGDFRNADFSASELAESVLYKADFTGARNLPDDFSMACPSHGGFIGWKKACYRTGSTLMPQRQCLVKLYIPEDAKRTSATTRKCRCDKAEVLAAFDYWGLELDKTKTLFSIHDPSFKYKVGDVITPSEPFDQNRWNECASGIHFFITKQDAMDF